LLPILGGITRLLGVLRLGILRLGVLRLLAHCASLVS
jgi:hypothetical protein